MLTAQELRIGNFVEYYIGSDGMGWVWHKVDGQDILFCEEFPDKFNKSHRPIPLTESILVAAGFVKLPLNNEDEWYWSNGPVELEQYDDGYILMAGYDRDVNNLHQLQNLYFVLTGEELPITTKELTGK